MYNISLDCANSTKNSKHLSGPLSKMAMNSVLCFLDHQGVEEFIVRIDYSAVSAYLLLQFFEEPIDLLINVFDTLLESTLRLFWRF